MDVSSIKTRLRHYVKRSAAVAVAALTAGATMFAGVAPANAVVYDKPINDPGNIMIQKALSDLDQAGQTEGNVPNLAGVKFRIEHFKNLYNSAAELEGKTPTASAVWATDENGVANYTDVNNKPIEGTWPYQETIDGTPKNVFPLGTVRITEVSTGPWSVLSTTPRIFKVIDSGDHKRAILDPIEPWKDNASTLPEGTPVVAFDNQVSKGSVEVVKTDDQTTHQPQGDGELAGVEYQIINQSTGPNPTVTVAGKKYNKGQVITTIKTAANNGKFVAATPEQYLPYGTYQIKETKVPAGYHNTGFDKTFTINKNGQKVSYSAATGNATTGTESWNANDVQRGGLQLLKVDRETGLNTALGETSLEGTRFDIINSSNHPVVYPKTNGKTIQPGQKVDTLAVKKQEIVDKNGKGTGKHGYTIVTAKDALPFGRYTVRESGVSEGYLMDSTSRAWSKTVTIGRGDGDIKTDRYEAGVASPNQIATITIDAEHLAGATSNQVQRTDLHFIKKDEDSMERMGNIAWKLTSKTTGETHFFVNDANGEFHSKSCDPKFNDNGTSTTGCRVRNNTVNNNDPDSPNSNGAIGKDDKGNYVVKDAKKLDNASGIWFTGIGPKSKDKDGATVKWKSATVYTVTDAAGVSRDVTVPNNLRALPYDTYELTELKTPGANDDHRMVSVTFKAHEFTKNPDGSINHDGHGVDFDYGTIDNKLMGMGTRLAYMGKGADGVNIDGEAGDKVAPAQKDIVLTDVIDYWGVLRGTYNIDGQLFVVENGKTVGEPVTTGHKQITIKNPITGRVAMQFEKFDASKYAGKTLVAFETMTNDKGEVIVEHRDAKDTDQWIKIPQIHTNAQGDIDDESNAERPEGQPIKITDTVTYKNLEVGKTYTMTAELHERDENGKDKGVVKDKDGKEVTSSAEFTPEEENGTTEVVFEFMPGENFAGKTVVAFEKADKNGMTYAAHTDISDEGQDVHFPKVETQAFDGEEDDKETGAYEHKSIKDTVKYTNLTPGREYTMTATLHVKTVDKDGKVTDEGELKDKDGNTVTKQVMFTPKESNGTVDVLFEDIDLSGYAGKTLVAFEQLNRNDVILGVHTDIEDEDQSVTLPAIATNMVDGNNVGDKNEDGTTNGAKDIQVKTDESAKRIEAAMNADADDTAEGDTDGESTGIDVDIIDKSIASFNTLLDQLKGAANTEQGQQIASALLGQADAFKAALDKLTVNDATKAHVEALKATADQFIADAKAYAEANKDQAQAAFDKLAATAKDMAAKAQSYIEALKQAQFVAPAAEAADDAAAAVPQVQAKSAAKTPATRPAKTVTTDQIMAALDGVPAAAKMELLGIASKVQSGAVSVDDAIKQATDVLTKAGVDKAKIAKLTALVREYLAGNSNTGNTGNTGNAGSTDKPTTGTTNDGTKPGLGFNVSNIKENSVADMVPPVWYDKDNIVLTQFWMHHQYELTLINPTTQLVTTVLGHITDGVVDKIDSSEVQSADRSKSALNAYKTLTNFDPIDWAKKNPFGGASNGNAGGNAGDNAGNTDKPGADNTDKNESSATENKDDKSLIDLKLVDTVRHTNLVPNAKYRLEGTIHVQAEDGTDAGEFKDKDGKPVTMSAEFTPKEANGFVELVFEATVKRSDLTGKKLVAFEKLFGGPKVEQQVADHEDINDEGQTVGIVDIGTRAIDMSTNANVGSKPSPITIQDTVGYTGLTVGKDYTVTGTLHLRDSQGKDLGEVKDKDGKVVIASTSLTPDKADGTVKLEFHFDADAKTAQQLAGNTIVAFESLSRDKFVVATHVDINDEAQSVHYVKIGTTLTGDDKKSKTVDVTDDKGNAHPASLIDTVAYENLVPGIEYTMTGQLMRDGKEFGSPVSVKFTPKEANGTVEIPFTVDVTDFGPATTLVAFETLTVEKDGAPVVVAEHKDLNDKDQTIIIAKPDKPVDKAWISLKTGMTFYGTWIALGMLLLTLGAAGYVAWKRYRI